MKPAECSCPSSVHNKDGKLHQPGCRHYRRLPGFWKKKTG